MRARRRPESWREAAETVIRNMVLRADTRAARRGEPGLEGAISPDTEPQMMGRRRRPVDPVVQ
jgi:hypothetical protein